MKLMLTFLCSLLFTLPSFADLQVFPLRATLSDKDRSAQLSLRHRGSKPERYRITTVFYKMGPDGSMTVLETPTEADHDGSKYFRFSPRQVVLQPNIEQVVRLMARIPADLPDGEYRCHLHFEAMNDDEQGGKTGGSTTQMVLKARMAVAIPIIIKKGETSVKVSLDKFKITKDKNNKYSFSVEMKKEGNGFAYGNIEIVSTPEKGEPKSLATINGVSSYIDQRTINFPLPVENLPQGKISILFKESSANEEKVLAQTDALSTP